MVPIVSFIGWHNSGKTTIIREVVRHLKQQGLRVAVIKSTKESGIEFDRPGTDTDIFRAAGADAITLMAPDQFVLITSRQTDNLITLIHRYFNNYDIVIGEGFKHERKIPKIEVTREGLEPLADQVHRVVATVTDLPMKGEFVFKPSESQELAEFIMKKFVEDENKYAERALLFVNGKKIPMKGFVQDALAGTVQGFIRSLKQTEDIADLELIVKYTADDIPRE
jgi:molybdopterin-guanine dinucleotide biosynthesis adapter protein